MAKIEDKTADVAAAVAATDAGPTQRIEIVGERRRAHHAAFRAQVVAESMAPGSRIQELARQHRSCASLIYRWRREAAPQVGSASAVQLVAVQVDEQREAHRRSADVPATPTNGAGTIEIEFDDGVRIRVSGEVSLPALRRVIATPRG